jgi:hypothetical protein
MAAVLPALVLAGHAGAHLAPGRAGADGNVTAQLRATFRRDPLRDGYILVVGAWCLVLAFGLVDGATDAVGWYLYRLPDPYAFRDYSAGYGFYFSPPVAYLMYPLLLLPWSGFAAIWTAIMFAALYGLVGRWSFLALLFPPVWWEIHAANINLVICLAAVWATRYPLLWTIPLLSKITPGIGVLWHLGRREWRGLAIAGVSTLSVAAVSYLVSGRLWWEWLDSLRANVGNSGPGYFTVPLPLELRLPVAGVIAIVAGARRARWALPIAVVLGSPVLWYNALAPLVAVPRLYALDRAEREASRAVATPRDLT